MEDAVGGPTRDERGREEGVGETEELVQGGGWLDTQGDLLEANNDRCLEMVRFLVNECGADVNIQTRGGWTGLMYAADEGPMDALRFLVEECDVDVNILNKAGWTALMKAAYEGHVDVVRFLVEECSADVNMKDNGGGTALMRAARYGHVDVVQFLVSVCAADVRIQDNYVFSALMGAVDGGRVEVMRFLMEQCGVDVNIQDKDGLPPLMKAVKGGHLDVVRFLVNECNADVNILSNGSTALMSAADSGHMDLVRFLVSEGRADVNIQNGNGSTALMEAALWGQKNIVRFLAEECSADVNIQRNDGWTALMWAASGGHVDIVRYLVAECSADVNIQDNTGVTALIRAARYGHVDVVRYLVAECSTDVNIQEEDGWTALMRAVDDGQTDAVRILVNEGGADINLRGNTAQSALRIASDRGHSDIVRLLTPFVQPSHQSTTQSGDRLLASDAARSIEIPASEVELDEFFDQGNKGGDFRVKWLGADAVVKLFISDASVSTFEQEVRAWQELRHPNVLKLYGVCQAAPSVNFFVCEYASQGSVAEYTISSSSSSDLKPLTWKFLCEVALGLEYLHERRIIHGDIRCSNILIGNDGMAKLSNFGSTDVSTKQRSVIRSMRWQAPEVLKGNPPSRESDVYSLGMCILEAVSGKRPWSTIDEQYTQFCKLRWNAVAYAHDEYDPNSPWGDNYLRRDDPFFDRRSRELVWQMCRQNPHERTSLTSIVSELEQLFIEGHPDAPLPEAQTSSCFEGCKGEGIKEQWHKMAKWINGSGNAEHCKVFDKLQHLCKRLQESKKSQRLLDRFYSLVTDLYRTVKMTPEEVWAMKLSSTRATSTSLISFTHRVDTLFKALGESVPEETEISWQQQRHEQGVAFVSGITDTVLLMQRLKSVEEQAALLNSLRSEIENHEDKFTEEQLRTMQKTYEAIESKLATKGVENAATLTPNWFIPWYELILDEGEALGVGGFGSVRRAKWLDSDVVVKQVLLPGSERTGSNDSFYDSLFAAADQKATDPQTVAKRAEAQERFRREADIWFGFSHPHVVRLFGACHIGRPFFVCEYATHGTLDSYLQKHPDDLWAKLHEAALGVQYLHAREVVHGDLKGNNIVVGSDLKAKVTDFGLSLAADSEGSAPISGAWHWVAPECLVGKKGEQSGVKPTFESDVYSLSMCIVEALRVVKAVQDGKPSYGCLPWGMLDPFVVKYWVTSGKMPSRPSICTDEQWNLVARMCVSDPKKRIKISTVVDELERFVTGTNTSNQVGHGADDMSALSPPAKQESVESMTAAARKLLSQLRGNTNQQDDSPVVLYDSLWDRIEHVREQIDEGNPDAACRSAFHSLVAEAGTSTASLEARSGDLISLARVVMGCYALSRRLDKLCDAYFLTNALELEFPSQSGENSDRQE